MGIAVVSLGGSGVVVAGSGSRGNSGTTSGGGALVVKALAALQALRVLVLLALTFQ